MAHSSERNTPRKRRRGAVAAGFMCLAAGLVLMKWLPWPFQPYALLFLVAIVLSIVAMVQRRVWMGLLLLLSTIMVPPALLLAGFAGPQQVADTSFRPPIEKPAYPAGQGPTVQVDEAHSNFHTSTGRYLPFAELLRRDGYVVKASAVPFTAKALEAGRVLVIANAVTIPVAAEVAAVRDWVAGGGSLLLIADHAPFDAAARELGKVFGVRFLKGAAVEPGADGFRLVFRRSEGTLADHPVTTGIDSVATFYGSAFETDSPGQPLLVFGPRVHLRRPDSESPASLKGFLQGAVMPYGNGRVAVFGEAAMFSAQLADFRREPMGMNAPIARQNPQFLLNVMHWLTGPG